MRIAIIGGGAIGLLFAHYLNEHHNVHVYVRNKIQADRLRSQGLICERDGKRFNHTIQASLFTEWKGEEDLTIVAVKQYSVPEVVCSMKKMSQGRHLSYLFLQNGMGHLKWIQNLQADHLFVGSVEHGALKDETGTVLHTGIGVTKLAAIKGDLTFLKGISESASNHFPFVFNQDYIGVLIEKLIVNSVINPLTALLSVRNGELLENPYYYRLFLKLFDEVSTVLDVSDKVGALNHVKKVCRDTAKNRSSMLKDIEEGRQTEIDAILGYILEEAERKKMEAPFSESLYCLVKGKE
ncbi:2-dehydropantoate 2-reductase [Bacillus sp. ISL-47]|uniref:2-dehydropantoate 2-reductase n=1 Tax=Bacillus sp. ISL-47 TaxID=2819130 RepID=UPI001BE9807E|nr:2-dehydropantoate 2-reductase [Bacillus sp. ISL-47]MBT2687926.1 2-dehydropantoate 2-reductase [Bacillus sp. ISL-47]MBT2708193.1 2-dehydropantoate 2-reductase [Pseudomonas sp. ISL-84]